MKYLHVNTRGAWRELISFDERKDGLMARNAATNLGLASAHKISFRIVEDGTVAEYADGPDFKWMEVKK